MYTITRHFIWASIPAGTRFFTGSCEKVIFPAFCESNIVLKSFWRSTISTPTKMNSEIKKVKTDKPKIGTHDGRFHCDEVLACCMLQLTETYKNAEIIRTRKEDVLKTCDIVVDVGSIFNKDENRFDHHQRTFNDTLTKLRPELGCDYNIRLSSAGLIYTYFGEEVLTNILKQENITLSPKSILILYKKIYENFIQEIDAIDNGVQICDGEPLYQINTHISARVGNFNPTWNCKEPVDENILFSKAKDLIATEFRDKVLYYASSWLPARDIVIEAIENAKDVHESGEILQLSTPCPWKEHLFELENEYDIVGKPKYILMFDSDNDWRVICVPRQPSSFICRKFLHKNWRGRRGDELFNLSNIEGISFCHQTGFIGGATTREGVYQMAVKSLFGDYVD